MNQSKDVRLSVITGGTHDIIQSDHYIGDRTSY